MFCFAFAVMPFSPQHARSLCCVFALARKHSPLPLPLLAPALHPPPCAPLCSHHLCACTCPGPRDTGMDSVTLPPQSLGPITQVCLLALLFLRLYVELRGGFDFLHPGSPWTGKDRMLPTDRSEQNGLGVCSNSASGTLFTWCI